MYICIKCKQKIDSSEAYEYRGAISCEKCFDDVCKSRDYERAEIIEENKHKTEKFRGIDLGDTTIGKANRDILKSDIDIAKKESGRLKNYERVRGGG